MVSRTSALRVQEIVACVKNIGQQQLKMRQEVNPPSYNVKKERKKCLLRMSNWKEKEGLSNLQVYMFEHCFIIVENISKDSLSTTTMIFFLVLRRSTT